MKTINLDLDGILVTEEKTMERAVAQPLEGTIEFTHLLNKEGYRVVIFTSRTWSEYRMTEDQLTKWGFYYDLLICGKPPCDYLVDDRAFSSIEDLRRKILI